MSGRYSYYNLREKGVYEDGYLKIIMVTYWSGGLRYSFIPAEVVIYLTPSWNPAFTASNADRVIRFPQDKEVYVYYMSARESIEKLILSLQIDKRLKAYIVLDPDDRVKNMVEQVRTWEKENFRARVSYLRANTTTADTDFAALQEAERLRILLGRRRWACGHLTMILTLDFDTFIVDNSQKDREFVPALVRITV